MRIACCLLGLCFAVFPLVASIPQIYFGIIVVVTMASAVIFGKLTNCIDGVRLGQFSVIAGLLSLLFLFNSLWVVPFSVPVQDPLESVVLFALIIVPGAALVGIPAQSEARIIWWARFFLCVLGCLISLFVIFWGRTSLGDNRYQIIGNMCALGFAGALHWGASARGGVSSLVLVLVALFQVSGVFLSGSRQAAVAGLIGAFVIGISHVCGNGGFRDRGFRIIFGLFAVAVTIIGVIAWMSEGALGAIPVIDRTIAGFRVEGAVELGSRAWLLEGALNEMEWMSPLGRGTHAYVNFSTRFDGGYPHNILVEGYFDYGYLGLLLILTAIAMGSSVVSSWAFRAPRDPRSFIAPLLASSFCFAMLSGDVPTSRFLWPILLGVIAMGSVPKNNDRLLTVRFTCTRR